MPFPKHLKNYRSGLEVQIKKSAVKRGHTVKYEAYKVPFTEPAKDRHYTPDFILDNGIVIESKGVFDSDDRQKHLLVKEQHPELEIRFVFSRAKSPIYKRSPTTHAMWAEKHGFQWAEKDIPDSWFAEPPQKKWLEAIKSLIPNKKKTK